MIPLPPGLHRNSLLRAFEEEENGAHCRRLVPTDDSPAAARTPAIRHHAAPTDDQERHR